MVYMIKFFEIKIKNSLGKIFQIFVDHHTLTFVVNQPIVIGRIAHQIMILMESDFENL